MRCVLLALHKLNLIPMNISQSIAVILVVVTLAVMRVMKGTEGQVLPLGLIRIGFLRLGK
jgi:hypothetical protein